jgi:long-chain acyl-CoA synthetase
MSKKHAWLASYPKGLDWDHMIDSKPLFSILDDTAAAFPEHTAIDFLGKHYCYREILSEANRIAEGLRSLGLAKGDRIGIMYPNSPQYVFCFFGILKAGGVVVHLSPLASNDEIAAQVESANVSMVFTMNLKVTYPKIAPLLLKRQIKRIIHTTLSDALPFPKNKLFPLLKKKDLVKIPEDDKHVCLAHLIQTHDDEFEPAVIDPNEDLAVLQFTGGTTGVPKAAMLTHANLYANAIQCKLWCGNLTEGEQRTLGVLPLFHAFAMTTVMNLGISLASTLILHPQFNINMILKDIHKKKPTMLPGVPRLYAAIANHPKTKKYDLTSLEVCMSGGAPLPMDIKRQFDEVTKCSLLEGYGLTETSPVASSNPLVGKQKSCIGLPLPQTEMMIEDMEHRGSFLGPNEKGEVCIKGPQVMKGYLNKPDATKEVLKDGILRTGDIGYMDEEGFFFIVDRLKEMLIINGFNVYPRNIEEVLYDHEAVLEAAVIGVPHPTTGQCPKAFVVLKEGCLVTEEELCAYLKEKLAKYEAPRQVVFMDELPKTPIGKIDKKALL